MKLISWNIDSLNAALTSDSARAQLSRAVIDTLVAENADIIAIQETKLSAKGPTKKHLQILEDYFPDYDNTWRSSVEPAQSLLILKSEHLQPWTVKGASSLLNLTISL